MKQKKVKQSKRDFDRMMIARCDNCYYNNKDLKKKNNDLVLKNEALLKEIIRLRSLIPKHQTFFEKLKCLFR
jgi:hypothetical protein